MKKRSKALEHAKAMATVDSDFEIIDYSNTDNYGPFFVKKMKNGKHVVRAYDPLFAVNQKCVKLRASISRMRRDFWGYTRKMENLQLHLWLFAAVNKGYELPACHVRTHLAQESRTVILTFHDEKVDDALKVTWIGDTAYVFARTILRHAGFAQKQGQARVQWDDEQNCLFVVMGDLLERK